LPRINYETRAGKPYRYVWGTGIQSRGDFLDSILKIDIEAGSAARWYEAGLYPGEPVFVPHPSAGSEDEGVLLSVVLDIDKDRSFLLVLDAATLEERARAEAPHVIPFIFTEITSRVRRCRLDFAAPLADIPAEFKAAPYQSRRPEHDRPLGLALK
jgi:beta,beta-carotene 9',10'-dioxygenase